MPVDKSRQIPDEKEALVTPKMEMDVILETKDKEKVRKK